MFVCNILIVVGRIKNDLVRMVSLKGEGERVEGEEERDKGEREK